MIDLLLTVGSVSVLTILILSVCYGMGDAFTFAKGGTVPKKNPPIRRMLMGAFNMVALVCTMAVAVALISLPFFSIAYLIERF